MKRCCACHDVPYTVGGNVVWKTEPCEELALEGTDMCQLHDAQRRHNAARWPKKSGMLMTGKGGVMRPLISLLAVSGVIWITTGVMIVAAFMRNDPALVGASAYCFIAASALLAFAGWVFNATAPATGKGE
jgi:hypothetical protein